LSFVGGVGIVVIAIMLDRVTRAMASRDRGGASKIFSRGKRSGRAPAEGEAA
jgi:ABC-type proline/glycine betaine transport system permease subunit